MEKFPTNDELKASLESLFNVPIQNNVSDQNIAASLLFLQEAAREQEERKLSTTTNIVQKEVNIQEALALQGTSENPASFNPALTKGWKETKESGVFVKPRQQKNGISEYSNVLDSSGVPITADQALKGAKGTTMQYVAGGNATPAQMQIAGNLEQILTSIEQAPDLKSKMLLFNDLQVSVAQQATGIMKEAQTQAEQKLGVDKLAELLAQNEAADRAHPMWAKYQSDSTQTAQVRSQLESARMKASSLANTFVAQNPTMAALKAKTETTQKMLELEWRKQSKLDDAKELSQLRQEERQANLEYVAEQKALALVQQFQPRQFARIKMLHPELVNEDDLSIARKIAAGKKTFSPEDQAISQASPEQLLRFAVEGNQQAAQVLVTEEAADSSTDPEVLKEKIVKARNSMNPAVVRKMLDNMYPDKKDEGYKSAVSQLKLAQTGQLTKDQRKAYDDMMFGLAMQGLRTQNTQEWISDVSKGWAWEDPAIKAAIDKVKANTQGPVSLQELTVELANQYPREQWATVAEKMRKSLLANRKEGVLNSTDFNAAWGIVNQEFTRSIMSSAGKSISNAFGGAGNYTPIGAVQTILAEEYKFLFGNNKLGEK